MEVEVSAKGSEKGQVSFAAAHTDAHSEAITSELKNLRETINKLVDRKSTSDESKQHHISLEAHMIRAEGILLENSKLESKVESLQNTLKETHAKTSEERERLEHKIACMRTELNSASDDARKQADTLEQVRIDMENQLKENQAVKEEFIRQINSLQVELDDVRRRFLESRELIEALNGELEGERQSMAEERRELQNSGSLLEREIEELSKANDALQFSISRYEEKIDSLENLMLPESEDQLCNALEKLKQFEEREVGLRLEMLEYEKRMKTLTEELSQVQEEREQERQHFQQLNEESSNAYEQMRKNLKEKDAIINDLKVEIEEALASLASESRKLSDTTEELQTLRSRMDGRTDELEKMLQEATSKLKQGTEEKELLEEKLAMIIEDVKENASFKEHVLAQSNEAHIANHLLKKRIEELEQDLQASKSDCDDARMRVETFHEREAELYKQLQESDRVRRSLHNRVMQLSGNIRVYIRVRPELPGEMEEVARSGSKTMPEASNKKRKHCKIEMVSPFQYPGMGGQESAGKSLFGADDPTKNILEVIEPMRDRGGLSERRKKWVFGFDNVFTPSHCQEDIWEATEPLVQSAIDGFNVTLFAYGQTGSGMYTKRKCVYVHFPRKPIIISQQFISHLQERPSLCWESGEMKGSFLVQFKSFLTQKSLLKLCLVVNVMLRFLLSFLKYTMKKSVICSTQVSPMDENCL